MNKVLYFIAGIKPTVDEQADIDSILAGKFNLFVRNGMAPTNYGTRQESCDFVAGTIPSAYSAKPVWEVNNGGKIIYFLAGIKPTTDEIAEIETIAINDFELFVRNASASFKYGTTIESCDFVAGTIPEAYGAFPIWEGHGTLPTQSMTFTGVPDEIGRFTSYYVASDFETISFTGVPDLSGGFTSYYEPDSEGVMTFTGSPDEEGKFTSYYVPFVPLFTDDFTSAASGVDYPGWVHSKYADDHPTADTAALKIEFSPSVVASCGGDHYFGGRSDLPEVIPEGKTIWYSQKRYHPSTQTWGYKFASGTDTAAATTCGQDADGNEWLKDVVLAPSSGTERIYVQPQSARRSIALPDGMRVITEHGALLDFDMGIKYPLDEEFTLQVGVKVASDGTGWMRVWINQTLVLEQTGANVSSGNSLKEWGIGNYWNGVPFTDGASNRNFFWVREIIIASDIDGFGPPTGTDNLGNTFINPLTTIASLEV